MTQLAEKVFYFIELCHHLLKLLLVAVVAFVLPVQVRRNLSHGFGLRVDRLRLFVEPLDQLISARKDLLKDFLTVGLIYFLIVLTSNLTEVHLLVKLFKKMMP